MGKIVSFQIVTGFSGPHQSWTPDVIALCEDGSLWIISLDAFYKFDTTWRRLSPSGDRA